MYLNISAVIFMSDLALGGDSTMVEGADHYLCIRVRKYTIKASMKYIL